MKEWRKKGIRLRSLLKSTLKTDVGSPDTAFCFLTMAHFIPFQHQSPDHQLLLLGALLTPQFQQCLFHFKSQDKLYIFPPLWLKADVSLSYSSLCFLPITQWYQARKYFCSVATSVSLMFFSSQETFILIHTHLFCNKIIL